MEPELAIVIFMFYIFTGGHGIKDVSGHTFGLAEDSNVHLYFTLMRFCKLVYSFYYAHKWTLVNIFTQVFNPI